MGDITFAMSHFEAPLPESLTEYKESLQSLFPIIFDTQFLAKSETFKYVPVVGNADAGAKREHRFGSMALGAVYKVFKDETAAAKKAGKPTIEIAFVPGHDRYADSTAFHEAGYDAYVTGYAFAHMAKQALSPECMSSLNGRTTIWKSLYHFNLLGEDELIAPGIYVHVAGLKGRDEKYLKRAIVEVKVPGAENGDSQISADKVVVRWLDDDSAFVILPEACSSIAAAVLGSAEGENGALKFKSWNDWLSAQTASEKTASEKRPASEKLEDEPPQKRAKTSS
jgi:hypothetical protein